MFSIREKCSLSIETIGINDKGNEYASNFLMSMVLPIQLLLVGQIDGEGEAGVAEQKKWTIPTLILSITRTKAPKT